jgi:hypothetical protein
MHEANIETAVATLPTHFTCGIAFKVCDDPRPGESGVVLSPYRNSADTLAPTELAGGKGTQSVSYVMGPTRSATRHSHGIDRTDAVAPRARARLLLGLREAKENRVNLDSPANTHVSSRKHSI